MKWEYYSVRVAGNIDVEPLDEAGSQGWELVAISGEIAYFKRPLPEPDAKPVRIVHGVNCPKAIHYGGDKDAGYGHGENDDGSYWIDGVPYCGRCHSWIKNYAKVTAAEVENGK